MNKHKLLTQEELQALLMESEPESGRPGQLGQQGWKDQISVSSSHFTNDHRNELMLLRMQVESLSLRIEQLEQQVQLLSDLTSAHRAVAAAASDSGSMGASKADARVEAGPPSVIVDPGSGTAKEQIRLSRMETYGSKKKKRS